MTQADILSGESSSDVMLVGAVAEGAAASSGMAETEVAAGDRLELRDVLADTEGADPNLGAYFTFETVDGNTVVSVDPDGAGSAPAVTVVTLEGVTASLTDILNSLDKTV